MSAFGTLLAKELRIEVRSREMFSGAILLTLLVFVIANLALSSVATGSGLAAAVLWMALAFASTLSLSRSLHRERDRGTWEALALLPVDWGLIYLAKAAANALLLLVVEAVSLPLYSILFNADLLALAGRLAPAFVLGAIGLSAVGTLLAAASSHARAREVLLPILLFPLVVPLLMMGIQATQRALDGAALVDLSREVELLLAFDATFLAIGWLTFDYLLGD